MKSSTMKNFLCALAICFCLSAFAGCAGSGRSADPGAWGYDCTVTYDALGGIINAREVRKTYYLPNSYLFMPSGASNMLVEPVRDGYILAGWYTAKTQAPQGSFEEYQFFAADRWDFSTDRVQQDMTLYARWLPRGKVSYVDALSGEVLFEKNITFDSPIQPLSSAVLDMQAPEGTTFAGYYADRACTVEYDFSQSGHVDLTPAEGALYAKLYEMFPQYLEQAQYVEPAEGEGPAAETDTSWLFLNKLGYKLKTADEAAIKELADAKDALVEEAISFYLTETANRAVYLKFEKDDAIGP